MHLGVNAIRLTRTFTGVGRYIECVLDAWSRMTLPFERVTLYTHTPLRQADVAFPLERYAQRVVGRRLPDPLWEATALRRCASEMDVLFAPSYTLPLGWPGRSVVTYHGPAGFRAGTPAWWRSLVYDRLHRSSAKRADMVLANSHAVERRLVEVYGVPAARVVVTHLAAGSAFRPVTESGALARARRSIAQDERPFALFVGKLTGRHGIPDLLAAFARARSEHALAHRLVLVGPDVLGLDVPARARSLGLERAVVHLPYVEHADLPALYSAAQFLVYPATEAEGFGLPVVEAMACGTPVVTVNQGSLREIAAGAALTTESCKVAELSAAMGRMATDSGLRQQLSTLGLARAAQFDWQATATRTLEVLEQVARAPGPCA